ncbi:MAG TPA: class I SAM-dependent methyltransferase [Candidatus Nitrosotenuis sp.]|nr:class I SAM-dependent methyltransferase [Candidatus Nitrosotenuis sp.]
MEAALSHDTCHLCGAGPSLLVPGFRELPRVTSDCKPWPSGGHLFLCSGCGTIHKNTDRIWLEETARIYADYTIYPQSGGVEQPVFVPETGGLVSRSRSLLDHLIPTLGLPEKGRLLDVGCGNGSFLRTFSTLRPGWRLAGTEFDDRYRALVEQIPNVEGLYTGHVGDIRGSFTMAAMVHVLEHIPWPGALLDALHEKLEPQGVLLLDLPDFYLNPFDLVVADHCSHFTQAAVEGLLARHGFETFLVTTGWIPKERVVVARRAEGRGQGGPFSVEAVMEQAREALGFLAALLEAARELRSQRPFGVFGTSIAGTWLYGGLEGDLDFWVEEDPSRIGRDYLGRPILAPDQAPPGSLVLIALAPALSSVLVDKFRRAQPRVRWTVPGDAQVCQHLRPDS